MIIYNNISGDLYFFYPTTYLVWPYNLNWRHKPCNIYCTRYKVERQLSVLAVLRAGRVHVSNGVVDFCYPGSRYTFLKPRPLLLFSVSRTTQNQTVWRGWKRKRRGSRNSVHRYSKVITGEGSKLKVRLSSSAMGKVVPRLTHFGQFWYRRAK